MKIIVTFLFLFNFIFKNQILGSVEHKMSFKLLLGIGRYSTQVLLLLLGKKKTQDVLHRFSECFL